MARRSRRHLDDQLTFEFEGVAPVKRAGTSSSRASSDEPAAQPGTLFDAVATDVKPDRRTKAGKAAAALVAANEAAAEQESGTQRLFRYVPNLDVHLLSPAEAVAEVTGPDPELAVWWLQGIVGTVRPLTSRKIAFPTRALDRLIEVRAPAVVSLDAVTLAVARAVWAHELGYKPLKVVKRGRRLLASSPRWPTALKVVDAPWPAIVTLERLGVPLEVSDDAAVLLTDKLVASGSAIATAGIAGSAVVLEASSPRLLERLELPGLAYAGGPSTGRYRLPLLLAKPLLDEPSIAVPPDVARKIRQANKRPNKLESKPGLPYTLYDFQKRDAGKALRILDVCGGVMLAGDMGSGKLTRVSTPVLTPAGWVKVGDLKVGDEVIGADGRPTAVEGVYPQGVKDVFDITFSDGSVTNSGDEHLWAVNTPLRNKRGNPHKVLPLREIREKLHDKHGNRLHFVPVVKPVQFAPLPVPLPLDPYLLGALLGDGSIKRVCTITSADQQVLDETARLAPPGVELVHAERYTWRFRRAVPRGRNPLHVALRELQLWGCDAYSKFIPPDYLFASVEDRIALLQGLMDTDGNLENRRGRDGNIKPTSSITFNSSSEQLAKDVQHLVQSLGGTGRISSRYPNYDHNGVKKRSDKLAYRVAICLPPEVPNPFRLERKAAGYVPRAKYPPSRSIEKVEHAGTDETVCIKVAADDGLYVTEQFLVTHNTTVSLALVHELDVWPLLVVGPLSSFSTWARQLTEMGKTHRLLDGTVAADKEWFNDPDRDPVDAVVISYDRLHAFVEEVEAFGFAGIVADEMQKVRTATSRRSRAIRRLAQAFPTRIGLTGTPISNKIEDILAPGAFLNPSEWKPKASSKDLADLYPNNPLEAATHHLHSLMVRRKMADTGVTLPDKHVKRVMVELTPDQLKALRALEEDAKAAKESGDLGSHMHIFARLQKMRQIVACPSVAGIHSGNPKVEAAAEIVEETLSYGKKSVVFCANRATWSELGQTFDEMGIGWVGIWGSSSVRDRLEAERRFHEDPDVKVFVGTIASCAEALTLSPTGEVAVFVDMSYTPSDLQQAEARIYRMNTTEETTIVYLHASVPGGSLDDRMLEILNAKKQLFAQVIDREEYTDPALTAPSLDDLVYMLTGQRPDERESQMASKRKRRGEREQTMSILDLEVFRSDDLGPDLGDYELADLEEQALTSDDDVDGFYHP